MSFRINSQKPAKPVKPRFWDNEEGSISALIKTQGVFNSYFRTMELIAELSSKLDALTIPITRQAPSLGIFLRNRTLNSRSLHTLLETSFTACSSVLCWIAPKIKGIPRKSFGDLDSRVLQNHWKNVPSWVGFGTFVTFPAIRTPRGFTLLSGTLGSPGAHFGPPGAS